MAHPLVDQLRFTRSELIRGLKGVSAEEALQRFGPMNSISWIVGHLADQEQRYWFTRRGQPNLIDGLNELVGFGKPASTPPLDEMWSAWSTITAGSDAWLDSLTSADLETVFDSPGPKESIGTLTTRVIYHYWYHLGEASAIRQMLGHTKLPQFVGAIGDKAPYRPE